MKRHTILTMLAILAAAAPGVAQTGSAERSAKAAQTAAERQVQVQQREVQREVQRQVERERREDQRAEQTETINRTVKIGAEGEIDLHNMSGDVTVTRGSGTEARIEAIKRARAATDEAAREMLGMVKVDISERPGRVEVRSHYDQFDGTRPRPREHRRISVSITYNITAPAGARLKVNTMSGGITVSDITGELVLEAMSGHIKIERAARVLIAKTMSGNVAIAETKNEGALDAGSMSGDVTLHQVTARRINAAVISGTVSLVDVQAERVDAQTTSGNLVFEGALSRNGRYRLGAHSGNVKVLVGGETGFELDASSFGGSVRSDLTLKNEERGPADLRRTRGGVAPAAGRTRTLRGTYGDGSAVLDLTTFSGTIVVGPRQKR